MTCICLLHEGDYVIGKLQEAGLRLSISYMRHHGSYLSVTGGMLAVICQLHE